MISERIIELVHGELDGRNGSAESQELQQAIATDADVRHYFETQKSVVNLLAEVEPVSPPSSLKNSVMGEVQRVANRGQAAAQVIPIRAASHRKWIWHNGLPVAFGLAAGILLTVAFWPGVDHPGFLNVEQLTGTITGEHDGDGAARVIGPTISVAESRVDLAWQCNQQSSVLWLNFDGSAPGHITVVVSPSEANILGIAQEKGSEVTFSGPQATITVSQANRYGLVIARPPQSRVSVTVELLTTQGQGSRTVDISW